jgi:hypothetical protein
MSNKLFDNNKGVVYVIIAFVVLLLLLFATKSRGSELTFEGGSAMVRGYTPALGLNINFPRAGPVNTDYEVGFLLSGQSTHHKNNPNAFTGYGLIVDGYKNFEMGLGFAYTNVAWEYTCQTTAALMARWRVTPKIAVQWRHFSSAGSCKPNAGRDFLTASWRF